MLTSLDEYFFNDYFDHLNLTSYSVYSECKIGKSHSFVALAFWNSLDYRNADGCINSVSDLATSCKNMVNFSPVTRRSHCSSVYLCICIRWKCAYPLSFGVLAFRNTLEHCNIDEHFISSNDHSISGRNLASFHPAAPEFTRLNCYTADVDQHSG